MNNTTSHQKEKNTIHINQQMKKTLICLNFCLKNLQKEKKIKIFQ